MKRYFINLFMREPSVAEAVAELGKEVKSSLQKAEERAKAAETAAHLADTNVINLKKELEELNKTTTEIANWRKEAMEMAKDSQKGFDELQTQVKLLNTNGIKMYQGDTLDFCSSLAKTIGTKHDQIQSAAGGGKQTIKLDSGTHMYRKAAANMTTSNNLTGDPNITYIPTPVILPRQLVNFRDLVPGFQSSTGLIVLFRENVVGGNPNTTPQVGAFGQQLTQGALKEQVGYTFTDVQFVAQYISGFVRVSKQMLQDLLFLQTYLPQMLLRDYYKFENATFSAAQIAASLGSTSTTGGNDAEKFIDYITNLEDTNFAPNAIVTTPTVWGKIMKTTVPAIGTSYSAPGGFYINPRTGDIEIAGIPIIKATWMPSGDALIGDWTQSQVATVDNLKVEFFEQDSDNVQRNLITARVEARVILITGQPYAFVAATGL